ncbi:glycosyltransferase family 4 protein [Christiangramia crocea]|uniref:Glycosyltransferase family 4 protein n=1 Tax=Christiangramia crocea TaxID=2904124 RepID=A0A9X1V057_9FLAO|nr:glycosyltransferase family 4 protein [Gramella crocea]MCG9973046.1 glycosyltransferase family 4 protein [Gramella crocea]
MKRILYIGNKLSKHGAAPTSVDILPYYLAREGYKVKTASSARNKGLRLFHMMGSVLFNSRKVELVLIDTYSTSNFWYAVICGMLCRSLRLPYIFILHGGNLDQRFTQVSRWVLNIFKEAKINIVPSQYLLKKLKAFNFNNIQLIPNWIDLKLYPFKLRTGLCPRLLWVRSFDEVYNPAMAVEVIEKLSKNFPHAELCMVGPEKDGSLERLKSIVRKKNLPVVFKGKLSKKEWIDLSKDFDVFINTTSVDNTPVSLLESMALGLPVVSTNVGGIPYMIENKVNGILVEPENPEAMVQAICTLLEDPELAGLLSRNSRAQTEKYDWEQVKPLWLELLN